MICSRTVPHHTVVTSTETQLHTLCMSTDHRHTTSSLISTRAVEFEVRVLLLCLKEQNKGWALHIRFGQVICILGLIIGSVSSLSHCNSVNSLLHGKKKKTTPCNKNGIALWQFTKKKEVVCTNACMLSVCESLHILMSARACAWGGVHTCKHILKGLRWKKKKITQLSCPVSIANKEYSAEDCRREQWVTLLSDVPLCCCCLSLQVVSYHACVCGLFHSYVLYTLCLCPLNCRLSVVFVCAVVCGLIFSLSSFLLCLSVSLHTPRASTLANKRTETATWKGFALKNTFSF